MNFFSIKALAAPVLITALILTGGCSIIARYDQVAYEHAVDTKVDTLSLMNKATGDYQEHQKDIETVTAELDKAYEYDRGRDLNRVTVSQWDILRDPERDLVGGFLKMWKAKGRLNPTFIAEKKKQIADAFDQIIQLEAGKLKVGK